MATFAVMMVRDEADIIEQTVTHLLGQVDTVIVADNLSVDDTRDILEDLAWRHPDEIILRSDPDPAYRQSAKMSALAAFAASLGANWVVPCDADEIWSHPEMALRDFLAQVPGDRAIVQADLYDHVATGLDLAEVNPVARLGWRRRESAKLHKVAVRPSVPVTIEMGNHGARYERPLQPIDGLVIRHFPYRSAEQMAGKVRNGWDALKAAPELPEGAGKHWRDYGRLQDGDPDAIGEIFRTWFWVADPTTQPDLIFDPCPL